MKTWKRQILVFSFFNENSENRKEEIWKRGGTIVNFKTSKCFLFFLNGSSSSRLWTRQRWSSSPLFLSSSSCSLFLASFSIGSSSLFLSSSSCSSLQWLSYHGLVCLPPGPWSSFSGLHYYPSGKVLLFQHLLW